MQNPPENQFSSSGAPANQIPPQDYTQNTGPYGGYGGPPARSGAGCGKLFGIGCGGCALVMVGLVVLAIVGFLVSNKSKGSGGSVAAVPAQYTGDWQGQDGTKISIRGDGTGNFDTGHKSVSGGTAVINETAKTLTITGLFNLNEKWHIDQAPQSVNGTDEMKLNGMLFRRTGGFSPSSTGSGSKSNTGFSVHYGSGSSDSP